MSSAFNRQVTYGGSFAVDQALLDLSQTGIRSGALVQQLGLQYSQRVTKLFDLTSNAIYYVGGRTDGSINMGRVVGPAPVSALLYTKFGDICQAKSNNVKFTAAGNLCSGGDRISFTAMYCLLNQLGLQISSEQMVITDSLGMMFGFLDIR